MADNTPDPGLGDLADRLHLDGEGGSRRTFTIYAVIGVVILIIVLLIKRSARNVTVPAATTSAPAPITINEQVIPTEAAEGGDTGTTTPPPATGGTPPPKTAPPPKTVPPPGSDKHGPPTKVPPPKKTPPPPAKHETYTVEAGDTLAEIAARHGVSLEALYTANKVTVDSWAEAHGHKPPYENWIFAGEVLTIP